MIAGGFTGGGTTASNKKVYTHRARYKEVYTTKRLSKQPRHKNPKSLSFGEKDCEGVLYPHDNALVVMLLVANYTARRILINNGSLADILFWNVLAIMDIDPNRL